MKKHKNPEGLTPEQFAEAIREQVSTNGEVWNCWSDDEMWDAWGDLTVASAVKRANKRDGLFFGQTEEVLLWSGEYVRDDNGEVISIEERNRRYRAKAEAELNEAREAWLASLTPEEREEIDRW